MQISNNVEKFDNIDFEDFDIMPNSQRKIGKFQNFNELFNDEIEEYNVNEELLTDQT